MTMINSEMMSDRTGITERLLLTSRQISAVKEHRGKRPVQCFSVAVEYNITLYSKGETAREEIPRRISRGIFRAYITPLPSNNVAFSG